MADTASNFRKQKDYNFVNEQKIVVAVAESHLQRTVQVLSMSGQMLVQYL